MTIIRTGHGAPATRIAIDDGEPMPGSLTVEQEAQRYWHGDVAGIHDAGSMVTVTMHVASDPHHVYVGQAQITRVTFREDAPPTTEFFGRGALERKPLAEMGA